jgi:phage FluMu protein Com
MIKFNCKSCGQKFSVPENSAGKKGKCPRCKNIVVVPEIQATSSLTKQSDSGVPEVSSKSSADNVTLINAIEKDKIQDQPIGLSSIPEQATKYEEELEEEPPDDTESPTERKLPWVIDIFLYPISIPCLLTLGIIISIPLLVNILIGLLGPYGILLFVPSFFINAIIGLYFLWYVAECIRDSAEGGIRAPETLAHTPGLGDLLLQLFRLLACLLIFAGPMGYYYVKTQRIDAIFWYLLAYAVFFLPMGLLAVTLFDSIRGLNPLLLVGSIFSTFFTYCGLILILGAVAMTVITLPRMLSGKWAVFVSGYLVMYILLVVAHLLGRFYWRYQEKLNWDV